jgi:thiamine biosynthesis protein ThiI
VSGGALLVRYGEIALKGGNRHDFLARLARNLRQALKRHPGCEVVPLQGRMLVRTPSATSSAHLEAVARVCGVTSISPTVPVESDLDAIERASLASVESALARSAPRTFRVTTNRADKRFPLRSMDVDRRLGAAILAKFPQLRVDLERPELELGVELREEGCFLYHERTPGPGGLPVGSLGRALVLLSGGIDSPVAAYLAMKRGLDVHAVFFHAAEFTGQGAVEKVKRIAQVLSGFEPRLALHLVPFGAVQVAVKDSCDPAYRTLLYRRAMHRIAVAIARRERLAALVSGDTLGQVASQTLENLALTAAASELPLLRPLLTYDKEETVALAKRIGTYELSILPEPDCCTLFQPARPRIRGDATELADNERRLDLAALDAAALAGAETWVFHEGAHGSAMRLEAVARA